MTDVIFVDSSAWFAATVPWDANHAAAAVGWLQATPGRFLTTDYIVDETLTLLKSRGERTRADELGTDLFSGTWVELHYLLPEEIQHAWDVFRRFRDKAWSFTDCTSKVVIEKLHLTTAFAFDHHFHQFSSVSVVP